MAKPFPSKQKPSIMEMFGVVLFLFYILGFKGILCEDIQLTTPLKVGEKQYTITFSGTNEGAMDAANGFCLEKGNEFDITEENFNDACLQPISSFLKEVIVKEQSKKEPVEVEKKPPVKKMMNISIDILGQAYSLSFDVEEEPMKTAEDFCENEIAAVVGKGQIKKCVDAVHDVIVQTIDSSKKEFEKAKEKKDASDNARAKVGKVRIPVKIDETDLIFDYNGIDTVATAVKKFCVKTILKLKIPFAKVMTKCVEPLEAQVEEFIARQVEALGGDSGSDKKSPKKGKSKSVDSDSDDSGDEVMKVRCLFLHLTPHIPFILLHHHRHHHCMSRP